MAKKNFFYIKVRVELDKEVNKSKLQEIAQELDYTIKSQTKAIKVVDTEIEENSMDNNFENTF